jgi:hypothetical protein
MIEFQFFEGCPNAKATYENLIEVAVELDKEMILKKRIEIA